MAEDTFLAYPAPGGQDGWSSIEHQHADGSKHDCVKNGAQVTCTNCEKTETLGNCLVSFQRAMA